MTHLRINHHHHHLFTKIKQYKAAGVVKTEANSHIQQKRLMIVLILLGVLYLNRLC